MSHGRTANQTSHSKKFMGNYIITLCLPFYLLVYCTCCTLSLIDTVHHFFPSAWPAGEVSEGAGFSKYAVLVLRRLMSYEGHLRCGQRLAASLVSSRQL